MVEMMEPDYAASRIGQIVAREVLQNGQDTGRWIVKVVDDDLILSLLPDDFRVIDRL